MPNDLRFVGQARAHVLHHACRASVDSTRRTVRLVTSSLNAACTIGLSAVLDVAHVDAVVADELARVDDAPLDEPVDHQALLLGREDRPGLGAVQRLDAPVEEHDVLERRRQLELQARLGDHFLDLTERVDDGRTGAGRR